MPIREREKREARNACERGYGVGGPPCPASNGGRKSCGGRQTLERSACEKGKDKTTRLFNKNK